MELSNDEVRNFNLGTLVNYAGNIFKVRGIGGNGSDYMHCSFDYVGPAEPRETRTKSL